MLQKFVKEEGARKKTINTRLVSVVILLASQIIIGGACLIYRATDDHGGDASTGLDKSHLISSVEILVQIAGQIHKPGLYTVASGTRIQQLIELAGGALDDADVNQLNLAAPLFDEQKVVVLSKNAISVDVGKRRGYFRTK